MNWPSPFHVEFSHKFRPTPTILQCFFFFCSITARPGYIANYITCFWPNSCEEKCHLVGRSLSQLISARRKTHYSERGQRLVVREERGKGRSRGLESGTCLAWPSVSNYLWCLEIKLPRNAAKTKQSNTHHENQIEQQSNITHIRMPPDNWGTSVWHDSLFKGRSRISSRRRSHKLDAIS